jgi:hypothetical protein
MDFMLRDKVVLMTGGAEGIDAATEGQTGRLFERNLLHCYNMAHYALPYLKQARGAIVSIAIPIRFLYLKPLPVIAIVLCSPCNARGGEAGVSDFWALLTALEAPATSRPFMRIGSLQGIESSACNDAVPSGHCDHGGDLIT